MRFEAGFGESAFVGVGGLGLFKFRIAGLEWVFAGADGEEFHHAEAVEKIDDSIAGVEQFDAVEPISHTHQDTEEGAVHIHALGEIEQQHAAALFAGLIDHGFEIHAGCEIGGAFDLDAGDAFGDGDLEAGAHQAAAAGRAAIWVRVDCKINESSSELETSLRLACINRSSARTSSALV